MAFIDMIQVIIKMFKNPLKYKSGGVTQSEEQEAENQLLFAIAKGLGAQPEQVKARLEQIKSNPDELKELQSALQLMRQDQNAGFQAVLELFAKPQSAKHGVKIQDFICKHKRGGRVAGCGCKEDGGIVKGQEGLPSINALRYIEREYDPEGNAVYTMAKTRETLPSNMRNNALSEYSQNGGEYQGNGQIQIIDFGNGKTRVNGDPYGAPVEVLLHGNDSTEALNRLRQLAKVANIKLGPAIKEQGGKVEKAQDGKIIYYPAKNQNALNEVQVENLYTPNFKMSLMSEPSKVGERRDSMFVFNPIPYNSNNNFDATRNYYKFNRFYDGPVRFLKDDATSRFEALRNLWEQNKIRAEKQNK